MEEEVTLADGGFYGFGAFEDDLPRFRTRLDLPKVGEHTREMLADLGYSAQQIDKLVADGVAHAA